MGEKVRKRGLKQQIKEQGKVTLAFVCMMTTAEAIYPYVETRGRTSPLHGEPPEVYNWVAPPFRRPQIISWFFLIFRFTIQGAPPVPPRPWGRKTRNGLRMDLGGLKW